MHLLYLHAKSRIAYEISTFSSDTFDHYKSKIKVLTDNGIKWGPIPQSQSLLAGPGMEERADKFPQGAQKIP